MSTAWGSEVGGGGGGGGEDYITMGLKQTILSLFTEINSLFHQV